MLVHHMVENLCKDILHQKEYPYLEIKLVRRSLQVASPQAHVQRQNDGLERSNPRVYNTRYFGHKVHLDQNKKLVMFGITYVIASDSAIMPFKKQ